MARKGTGPNAPETEESQEPKEAAAEETEEITEEVETEEVETEEEVPVQVATEEPKEKGSAKKADPRLREMPKKKREMATIIIGEKRNDEEPDDVFVTDPSNGIPYNIQRGKQVDVPIGVLNNLREAVQEKLVRNRETGEEKWKPVPRFNFQVLREYTEA
jgi:hypothetical protein